MSTSNLSHDADEFTGKRILVTSGSKGIGEAIVNRLRRGGGTVLATARTIPAGADAEQFIQADVSTRAGSTVVEVAGSHAIYESQPNAVTKLIESATKGAKS